MTKTEGPAQEPQMSEPTHKLPESLPYQMMIGDLRRCLFTQGDSAWNGYIRDMTAELEQTGEYVNVAEAFSRINAKAAKMMGALEFQKAMGVPATPAPSQPAGAREWQTKLEQAFYTMGVEHRLGCEISQTDVCTCGAQSDRREFKNLMTGFIADYNAIAQQTAAKDEEIGLCFDVIFGYVPEARDEHGKSLLLSDKIEILGKQLEAAERERDSLREANARLAADLDAALRPGSRTEMSDGTVEKPIYRKVCYKQPPEHATPLFLVSCDEGWRESIVCEGMYEWAADWLIEQIQGRPYAPGKH